MARGAGRAAARAVGEAQSLDQSAASSWRAGIDAAESGDSHFDLKVNDVTREAMDG